MLLASLFATVLATVASPSDYEKVAFLESTGTQWIDTGIEPDCTTVVSLDWQSLKASGEFFQVLAGTRDENNNQMTALISTANNLSGGVLGESGPVTADGAFGRFSRYIVTLDAVSNAIFFDGVMRKYTTRTVESLPSIYLFARHSPTGAEAVASGRLYGCQIHKGGALVRDFVPCRRISDGKLGLYDQESNEFYGNDGSGDFASSISEDDFDRYFFPRQRHRERRRSLCQYGNLAQREKTAD